MYGLSLHYRSHFLKIEWISQTNVDTIPCVFTGIVKTVENQMTCHTMYNMLIVNEANQRAFSITREKNFVIKINTHYKFLSS